MEGLEWFIDRYIHTANARTFCRRLHKLDAEELTTDQKKKVNYELKRRYKWLNFKVWTMEEITYITARNEASQWAEGEIHKTPKGFKYISW